MDIRHRIKEPEMKLYLTLILAVVANFAIAGTVTLPQPVSITATATTAQYDAKYNSDNGDWYISVQPDYTTSDETVWVRAATLDYTVTGEMIAEYAGLDDGQKPSDVMTGKQISDTVMGLVVQMFYTENQ